MPPVPPVPPALTSMAKIQNSSTLKIHNSSKQQKLLSELHQFKDEIGECRGEEPKWGVGVPHPLMICSSAHVTSARQSSTAYKTQRNSTMSSN